MPSFAQVRSRFPMKDFHCHHIIPTGLVGRPSFSVFFGHLRAIGFDPQDFETNGMHLPSTEQMALICQKPLHRGPHRQYNQMVSECIASLLNLSPENALIATRRLQIALRHGLRRQEIVLGRNAPKISMELRNLETEANLLYGLVQEVQMQ